MKQMKKFLSLVLVLSMLFSLNIMSVSAADTNEEKTGYIEISLEDVDTYASSYYSKGLVMLNIATAGVSNECRITSGSVPTNAKVSKVELRGTKSTGSGTVKWYVEHEDSGHMLSTNFASPATITGFNGYAADSAWVIWIEGSPWSTVKSGSIKVYYTY